MAKVKGTHHVVSASLTGTGAPAYLKSDGSWASTLSEAAPFHSPEEAEARAKTADRSDQRLVCDPYTFTVLLADGTPQPISERERIRAEGPSVRVRRPD